MKTTTRRGLAMLALVFTIGPAGALQAQDTPRERARATLPPAVFEGVTAVAEDMAAAGVPAGPLYNKALEGAAKRVPRAQLVPAVRSYAGRLQQARTALGPAAGVPLLVAGADAIQRGVPMDAIRSLPTDRPRSPVALLVLAELLESGVPQDRAIRILRVSMDQRLQDARMLDIPLRVRRLIRDGATPADAIERVRRNLRRDRGGSLAPLVPTGDQIVTDRRLQRRLDRWRGSGT